MTDTPSTNPFNDATTALYTAVLQLEQAAKNARAESDTLTAAAQRARAAYEDAAIHTDGPRCGITESPHGYSVGPCARPAEHPEAYCRNAAGTGVWLREKPRPTV